MIEKIRYPDGRDYICDDCKKVVGRFGSYRKAQAAGWAVSDERTHCYCPNCAPNHRNTGRAGALSSNGSWLPIGWEQTKIENLG